MQEVRNATMPQRIDVVFSPNGIALMNHPGNVVYSRLINTFEERYSRSTNDKVKSTIIESIVDSIKEKGGKFLQSYEASRETIWPWHEISQQEAISRTRSIMDRTNNEAHTENHNMSINPSLVAAKIEEERRIAVGNFMRQQQLEQEQHRIIMEMEAKRRMTVMAAMQAGVYLQSQHEISTSAYHRDRVKAMVDDAFATTSAAAKSMQDGVHPAVYQQREHEENSFRMRQQQQLQLIQSQMNTVNGGSKVVPKPNDVLLGADHVSFSRHPGNRVFDILVVSFAQKEAGILRSMEAQKALACTIVQTIKEKHDGRFLQSSETTNAPFDSHSWYERTQLQATQYTLYCIQKVRGSVHQEVLEQERFSEIIQEKRANANSTDSSRKKPVVVTIKTPGETDVLIGAGLGEQALKHPGNQAFRSLIACNLDRYRSADSVMKKRQICHSIVAAIAGQDGRFLRRNKNSGWWDILSEKSIAVGLTEAILNRVRNDSDNSKTDGRGQKSTPIDLIDDDDHAEDVNPKILPKEAKISKKRDPAQESDETQAKKPDVKVTAEDNLAPETVVSGNNHKDASKSITPQTRKEKKDNNESSFITPDPAPSSSSFLSNERTKAAENVLIAQNPMDETKSTNDDNGYDSDESLVF